MDVPWWAQVVSRVDAEGRRLPAERGTRQGVTSNTSLVPEPCAARVGPGAQGIQTSPPPPKTQTQNSGPLLLPRTLLALKEGVRFVPKLPHGVKDVSQIPSLKPNAWGSRSLGAHRGGPNCAHMFPIYGNLAAELTSSLDDVEVPLR